MRVLRGLLGLLAGAALTLFVTARGTTVLGFPVLLLLMGAGVFLLLTPRRRPEGVGSAAGVLLAFALLVASAVFWGLGARCAQERPDGTVVVTDCG